nr:hypothetical protein [Tanacetum cinerariifolium]
MMEGLTITQHSLPKKSESAFAKPEHMIASSSSRDNSKNMLRFSSNDMVHNHYLDDPKKKTRERDRNSTHSVMTSARFQSTTADSKPKPRSTNHSSRSLPMSKSSCVTITAMPKAAHSKSPSSFSDPTRFFCSTCHKCVFNANHDACITKLLKEVNSRTKIQSHKTRDSNKPIDQKSHTQTPGRQIFTGHKFSSNKNFAVYKKTSPRSDLRWKPTGRIFKSVGFRWLPTGKLFDSCTSKVEREPTHGFNADISNIHECKQILDLSADDEIRMASVQNSSDPALTRHLMASVQNSSDPALTRHSMASVQDSIDPGPTRHSMASAHNCSDPTPTCQTKASVQISSDPAPECQTMASAHNCSDPTPTCQTKASVQISSDPAPECQTMALEHNSLCPRRNCQENVSHGDKTATTSNELDLLFSPMFDELLNGSSKVVSKSSTVSAADALNQRQQPTTPLNTHTTPVPTCQNLPITTVISSENINQAEPHAENNEVADDEFINIFSTP